MSFTLDPEVAEALAPFTPPPGSTPPAGRGRRHPPRHAGGHLRYADTAQPHPDDVTITGHELTTADDATIKMRWYAARTPPASPARRRSTSTAAATSPATPACSTGRLPVRVGQRHPHPVGRIPARPRAPPPGPGRGRLRRPGLAARARRRPRRRPGPHRRHRRQRRGRPGRRGVDPGPRPQRPGHRQADPHHADARRPHPDPRPAARAVRRVDVGRQPHRVAGHARQRRGGPDTPAYAAPARVADPAGLPPAYIEVGQLDIFRDEDLTYARASAGQASRSSSTSTPASRTSSTSSPSTPPPPGASSPTASAPRLPMTRPHPVRAPDGPGPHRWLPRSQP